MSIEAVLKEGSKSGLFGYVVGVALEYTAAPYFINQMPVALTREEKVEAIRKMNLPISLGYFSAALGSLDPLSQMVQRHYPQHHRRFQFLAPVLLALGYIATSYYVNTYG